MWVAHLAVVGRIPAEQLHAFLYGNAAHLGAIKERYDAPRRFVTEEALEVLR